MAVGKCNNAHSSNKMAPIVTSLKVYRGNKWKESTVVCLRRKGHILLRRGQFKNSKTSSGRTPMFNTKILVTRETKSSVLYRASS